MDYASGCDEWMTTKLDTIIDSIELELNSVIHDGNIGVKKCWFTDVDDLASTIQYPTVLFMLQSAKRNDMQVLQDSNRLSWDLNYDVLCIYSGLEGKDKFTHARRYVNSVYNLLQTQHIRNKRLNGECFNIGCDSIKYGIVPLGYQEISLKYLKQAPVTGGVIKLIIQVIEIF